MIDFSPIKHGVLHRVDQIVQKSCMHESVMPALCDKFVRLSDISRESPQRDKHQTCFSVGVNICIRLNNAWIHK